MKIQKPWMQLYVADFIMHVNELAPRSIGAYILLSCRYWAAGSLPIDDDRLSRITKLSLDEWKEIKNELKFFFSDGDSKDEWVSNYWDGIRYGASEMEKKERELSDKRRNAATRRSYGKRSVVKEGDANVMQNACKTHANVMQNVCKTGGILDLKLELERDNSLHSLSLSSAVSEGNQENQENTKTKKPIDLDQIQAKLSLAAGDSPCGANPDISPIIRLMAAGHDLEGHILPVVRDLATRQKKPRNWHYVATVVQDRAINPAPMGSTNPEKKEKASEAFAKKMGIVMQTSCKTHANVMQNVCKMDANVMQNEK